MKLLLRTLYALVLVCSLTIVDAQKRDSAKCYECALPKGPKTDLSSSADITFHKGEALNHVTSVKRILVKRYDQNVQALSVRYMRDNVCRDTTLFFGDVKAIVIQGLGMGGATVSTPIFPAREYFLDQRVELPPANFFELTPMIGYAGAQDEAMRNTGFDNIYYGLEALVAPFGRMLGNQFSLGIGGGLFQENSRTRIPLFGQLRYTFVGAPRVEQVGKMLPGPCTFRQRDLNKITESYQPFDPHLTDSLSAAGYVEVQTSEQRDSVVYYIRHRAEVRDDFRPFLFVEAGPIFNSNFDGAGKDPSINPEDYSQYLLGAGIGLPLWNVVVLELQYRYMRLNLRTPCPTCPPTTNDPDHYYFLNTNSAHSILLKAGYRLEW